MQELREVFIAWFIGVLSGFLVSIPVGPINITIVNEGARKGFWWGLWIGLGAVVMEVLYCAVAFAGFAGLFSSELLRAAMELISFLLLLFLGLKYLGAHSLPVTTKSVGLVEHRLHPHTAFMTGFVRVLGNPGVLLLWITLSATFLAHAWMADTWLSRLACVTGVGMGALAWFVLLSFAVSLGHGKFSPHTLVRMAHVSAVCLLVAAGIIGGRLVVQLSKSAALKAQVQTLEEQLYKPFPR